MKTFRRIGITLIALFCCCIASAEELQNEGSKGGTILNSAESNSRPKGYRGRVEAGEITDIADGGIYAGFSVSTTHGYQFTPDFF